MAGDLSDLDRAQQQKRRGIVYIVVGIVAIVFGALTTWVTYDNASNSGGTYVIAYGPIVFGVAAILRGMFKLNGAFTAFIALRYLMSRNHRVSKIMLFMVGLSLLLGIGGLIVEHTLMTRHNPLKLEPELLMNLARVVSIVKVAGFVLLFFMIIIGGLRYFFSFFTTVPLVGVWIGTGALVCVLSVMSGFESDLRQKILGSNAHIQVTRNEGDFVEWHEVKARIDKIPGVLASTPYAMSEVVIAANNNGMPVIIKGIDPNSVGTVTDLVSDLEDRDAIKRLAPLVEDQHDLHVPQSPQKPSNGVDPSPPDMPGGGDPIDFSQPAKSDGDADGSAVPDVDRPTEPPHVGSARDGSDKLGSDAAQYLVGKDQLVDPAPPDLATTDEPPRDYSDAGSGSIDPAIRVVDLPLDSPALSRRTQALPGILVGRELVKQTHLYTGEEVRVVSPLSDPANPDATGTPVPFNRDYRVAGIFFTGMYEYDLKYVYVSIDSLQDFLDRGDIIDGIEVRVGSPDETPAYVQRISELLGPQYSVKDWQDLNRSLFAALKLEKIAMFLVLGIVILVASFSIVGNLIMVVVEKAREIALLKTLGASDNGLMGV
ncbi:MAG: hypothetical protein JWO36_979, partial [Myxococcales bacterium]|nr:hypothetical protein [Myxococcales bacterium]